MSLISVQPASAFSEGVSFSAVSQSTWQADGVAYAVTSTRGKVFVGGSFTAVRPPEGSSGTPRQSPALVVLVGLSLSMAARWPASSRS